MLSRVRGRALTRRTGNEGNGLLGFAAAHRSAFALRKGYQVVKPLKSGLHVTSLYAEAKETCDVQLTHTTAHIFHFRLVLARLENFLTSLNTFFKCIILSWWNNIPSYGRTVINVEKSPLMAHFYKTSYTKCAM